MQITTINHKQDIIYDKASDIYKYVYQYFNIKLNDLVYIGQMKGNKTVLSWNSKTFTTEKEAAKAVDLELIRRGKEPVNVLKKL